MRPPFSVARIKQKLNPLHPSFLRLEASTFVSEVIQNSLLPHPKLKLISIAFMMFQNKMWLLFPMASLQMNSILSAVLENREAMRQKLGLAPEHVALLFVANELERKGYHTLISALSILKNPRFRLLVVGRPEIESVRNIASAAGVEDQVVAYGSSKDVGQFHAASDVFVLPTQYEAFCLAILEALGSGLPVLTTQVPGAKDAIIEGQNGYTISDPNSGEELAEALKLILDDDVRSRLTSQAAQSVQKYQWPAVLEQYEEVLREYSR